VTPDPKPRPRIHDPSAMQRAHYEGDCCVACGVTGPLNAHHVLSRARGGDDVPENLLLVCGSGTTGCHGMFHAGSWAVAAAIGLALTPAHVAYVLDRLGETAGRDFLLREYAVE
jgi:hypothetical protein